MGLQELRAVPMDLTCPDTWVPGLVNLGLEDLACLPTQALVRARMVPEVLVCHHTLELVHMVLVVQVCLQVVLECLQVVLVCLQVVLVCPLVVPVCPQVVLVCPHIWDPMDK